MRSMHTQWVLGATKRLCIIDYALAPLCTLGGGRAASGGGVRAAGGGMLPGWVQEKLAGGTKLAAVQSVAEVATELRHSSKALAPWTSAHQSPGNLKAQHITTHAAAALHSDF